MNPKLKELCGQLFDIGALKFGDFKMKVGARSPVYFDLRVIISYPKVMNALSDILWSFAQERELKCDNICGVPYTALPIASVISVKNSIPMVIRRKEAKDYGTKKMIEGKFNAGDRCIIVEDVVTTGSSILETVKDLRKEGLEVTDTVVVVNREQGALTNLTDQGVTMHALLSLTQILDYLKELNKIDAAIVESTKAYIKANQLDAKGEIKTSDTASRLHMSYAERAKVATSPVSKRLFQIMEEKKTNLCLAADVTTSSHLLKVATSVGPYICMLKTHADIVTDFSVDVANELKKLAGEFNFLIMEDRKFSDIGHTVSLQYAKIYPWADLVTAHSLPGEGVLAGIESIIKANGNGPPRGVFLVAEMSCEGNLITPQYTQASVRQVSSYPNLVAGIVCQSPDVVTNPGLIQLTPGVQAVVGNDNLGQKYNTPDAVVKIKGADVAVVGRGIIEAASVTDSAKMYRQQLWTAYVQRHQES